MKQKILFICVHNRARSEMAALINESCGEFFEGESAGLEPGALNPLAMEALPSSLSVVKPRPRADFCRSNYSFAFAFSVPLRR